MFDLFNVEKVKEVTRKWEQEHYLVESDDENAKAREAADIIMGGDWGCAKDRVVKLVSVLIGQDIGPFMRSEDGFDTYPIGCCVVPLENPNGHVYDENIPCIVMKGREAIKVGGKIGNNLPKCRSEIRPATDEEIDLLFAGHYTDLDDDGKDESEGEE